MRLPPPITSRTNARVKALRAALSGRAAAPGELAALEGEHLLSEAVRANLVVEALFVREGSESVLEHSELIGLQARDRVVLAREVFDGAVDTATPQGVAATFAIPDAARIDLERPGAVLVLENVQDPGNVGTLIRSAAAFGAAAVLLAGDCANPWSPKVLRASAGAVFHVPVAKMTIADVGRALRPARRLFAAVPNRPGAVRATEVEWERPALMIGNEGRGLTPAALAIADEMVTIPCRIESLNAAVAGSLLLYECLRKQSATQPNERAETLEAV